MPRGNVRMTYYLQYGTLLLDRSFERRVDTTRLEGQGLLKGWRLDFSRQGGQPNVVEDASSETWGLLYLIDEIKLPELDALELGGKRRRDSCLFEWERQDCVFYTYPRQPSQPSEDFLQRLRTAYRQAGLPQRQINDALGIPTTLQAGASL